LAAAWADAAASWAFWLALSARAAAWSARVAADIARSSALGAFEHPAITIRLMSAAATPAALPSLNVEFIVIIQFLLVDDPGPDSGRRPWSPTCASAKREAIAEAGFDRVRIRKSHGIERRMNSAVQPGRRIAG
jgi:hypothetical protein